MPTKSPVADLLLGKGKFIKVKHGNLDFLFTKGELEKAQKRTNNLSKLTTTPEGKRNYQRRYMREKRKKKRKK